MYSFLRGIIADKYDNTIVVDCGGVGYEAFVSSYCFTKLGEIGATVTLYTYLHCREDEMSLYGFIDKIEREVFKKLISVNGVGPKMAILVLSSISARDLTVAVATQQPNLLKGIKGVGTKIRERILLELKEKMSLAGVEAVSGQITMDSTPSADDTTIGMATTVLINWGVNKLVAEDLISKVATPQDTLETLLQKAFKSLGR